MQLSLMILFMQVNFFLKKRIAVVSDLEFAKLHKLSMGLCILGSLPLPWQQRCSALHEHPQLILETLLMWKELHVASQVQFLTTYSVFMYFFC
jgi:zinc finger FYVE domain-containing protein 26